MDVEARVAELAARGELAEAASAAIEGYGPSVYGYLCSLLDEDDARDVFSQWAEDLWRGLPGFRRECTLRAWVFKLAWHAAARFRRDPYRARRERLPTGAASRLAASTIASSVLHGGGRHERLRRLRASLPPEDETLLVLRIDKELEWEEIAAVLSGAADGGSPGDGAAAGAAPASVTAPALRKRFERLKDRLAERAREEGLLD